LPLDPRFAGSNAAESDGFFRSIKVLSTTSLGGEVKPSAPCRKILPHVNDPLRYDRQNSSVISRPISLASLLGISEQRTLVDESHMIRTEMGTTVDQKMVAVAWGALFDTTP
jgi:hypothetical protein